jgi:uncharacterized membrane protein YdcZ (DUF606 family)
MSMPPSAPRLDDARSRPSIRLVAAFLTAVCAGAVLIAAFEHYRAPLTRWVADPAAPARTQLVVRALETAIVVPLLFCAAGAWHWARRSKDGRARLWRLLGGFLAMAALAFVALFWRLETLLFR